MEEEKKIQPVEMNDKLLTDQEKQAVEEFLPQDRHPRHQYDPPVRRRRPEKRGRLSPKTP